MHTDVSSVAAPDGAMALWLRDSVAAAARARAALWALEPWSVGALLAALAVWGAAWALGRRGDRAPLGARARFWLVTWYAAAAAALSAAYVASVLRGAPRIIDATTYFYQAQQMAALQWGERALGPSSSLAGRFLVRTADGEYAGLFPPAYPALLAWFQLASAPMALGPVLAAALCAATAWLASRCAPPAQRTVAACLGAALSASSMALRYHTADTMAHALVMLCATVALGLADDPRPKARWLLGLLCGVTWATRFGAAVWLGLAVLVALRFGTARGARRGALWFALGALPPLAMWLEYQGQVTGSAWRSPQSLYYALADWPAGCFRYGFGGGIGCSDEHGEFVRAHFADHVYGARAALGVSARRLWSHALDVLQCEWLYPIAWLAAYRLWRRDDSPLPRASRLAIALAPCCALLAYAPFYFDGNYPGGGARMLSEVLPLEHAAIAVWLAQRSGRGLRAVPAWGHVLALSLVGLALRQAPTHFLLRERDGGVPLWDEALRHPQLTWVDSDHALLLGAAPHKPPVRRWRGDSADVLTAWAHGARESRRVRFDSDARRLFAEPWTPPQALASLWFEAEHEWPARNLTRASARRHAAWDGLALPCASAGQVLSFVPNAQEDDGEVTTALWLPQAGEYRVNLRWAGADPQATGTLQLGERAHALQPRVGQCTAQELPSLWLPAGESVWRWRVRGGAMALDAVELWPQFGTLSAERMP